MSSKTTIGVSYDGITISPNTRSEVITKVKFLRKFPFVVYALQVFFIFSVENRSTLLTK